MSKQPKYSYICEKCTRPAFHLMRMPIEGEPVSANIVQYIDGTFANMYDEIRCGNCRAVQWRLLRAQIQPYKAPQAVCELTEALAIIDTTKQKVARKKYQKKVKRLTREVKQSLKAQADPSINQLNKIITADQYTDLLGDTTYASGTFPAVKEIRHPYEDAWAYAPAQTTTKTQGTSLTIEELQEAIKQLRREADNPRYVKPDDEMLRAYYASGSDFVLVSFDPTTGGLIHQKYDKNGVLSETTKVSALEVREAVR